MAKIFEHAFAAGINGGGKIANMVRESAKKVKRQQEMKRKYAKKAAQHSAGN